MKRVLTIAGAAAQGSAGIQADLKTFQERDVYGISVITATVAANSRTNQGIFIRGIEEIEAQFYAATEKVGLDAIKTGMLFSVDIINRVSELIEETDVPFIVIDPVMVGKMGSQLLADDAIEALKERIIPQATIITPNRFEAEKLLNTHIPAHLDALTEATKKLYTLGCSSVLVKGGIVDGQAVDFFYDGHTLKIFQKNAIDTVHTSGAGCTYAACLTAELAKGKDMLEAIQTSKEFVHAAIKHALAFGKGIGSVRHGAYRQLRY